MRSGFLKRFTATLLAVMMLIGVMPTTAFADDVGVVEFDRGLTSTHSNDSSLKINWSSTSGNTVYYSVAVKALSGYPQFTSDSESGSIIGGYSGTYQTKESVTLKTSALPEADSWIKVFVKGFGSDKKTVTDEGAYIYVLIEEAQEEEYAELSRSTYTADAEGNEDIKVSIEANIDWSLDCSTDEWITLSKNSGSGDGVFYFDVEPNTRAVTRTATIWLMDKGRYTTYDKLTITQNATEETPYLIISPVEIIDVPGEGGTYILNISSNTNWEASVSKLNKSWISINATTGIGDGTIKVTVSENGTDSERTGKILIDSVDGEITNDIFITQATIETLENPTLSNFSVTPASVVEGEALSIQGTISGNGNKITAVSVGVRNVADEQLGGNWGQQSNLNADSFELSNFGSLTTGGVFGNTMLTAGTYVVEVYVTTDSGMSFANKHQQTVTITSKAPSYIISVDTLDTTGSETANTIQMKGMLHISGDKSNCDVGFEYWSGSDAHKQQTMNIARYDGETFEMTLSSLEPDTEYHYRAYATYMKGGIWLYEYGETVAIRTKADTENLPVVTSKAASSITATSATLNARLEASGGVETEYGFIFGSTGSGVTTSQKYSSGINTIDYSCNWTGLEPNHSYTYWAYAKNEYGTVKGEAVTFTTEAIEQTQLDTPVLEITSAEIIVGEKFTVTWSAVENATEYSVYVWDANGSEVKRNLEQTALNYSTSLSDTGVYTIGVYATNGASYVYTQSECGAVNITVIECPHSNMEWVDVSATERHYRCQKCGFVSVIMYVSPPADVELVSPIPTQSSMTVNRGETVTISWSASEGAERYGVWFYDTDPGTYVDAGSSLSVTHVFEHNNPKDVPFAVQIYALAGTGENQKQSKPATVLVTVGCEDGKHDFTGTTVYDRTLYKEIAGDNEYHLAYADVYKQTCIECGMEGFESTVERDEALQEKEKHSYVNGVCQVEGCGHVCAHQYEYKLENGLNVAVPNSGKWVKVDDKYCKKLVRYWEECTYCGLEREGTTEHEDGSVSEHLIGTIDSYTPLKTTDPDYTTKHLWTTTYQPCSNGCGYKPEQETKTERCEHTIVDRKCEECGYLDRSPLQKIGLFKFTPSPAFEYVEDMIYGYKYDESWFFEDSTKYQHDLVKMSVRAAMAAYGVGSDSNDTNIRYLMEDCLEFYDVETSYPKPTLDTIGYAIGRKNIVNDDGEKCALIMVAVRGGNYSDEWGNNFVVGTGKHHEGFENAAHTVYSAILNYIEKYEDKMEGDTKIWISGYSRGAATANLVAAKLHPTKNRDLNLKKENIYAFCFECPRNSQLATSSGYEYISNFVNPIDFVPKVVMSDWDYGRYGNTYYTPYQIGNPEKYPEQKEKMVEEYAKLLDINKIVEGLLDLATNEWSTQERFLNELWSAVAAGFKNKFAYVDKYQDALVQLVLDKMGTGRQHDLDFIDWAELIVAVLPQIPTLLSKGDITFEYLFFEPISYGHYAELCMAWLDSLEGEFSYADPTYRILYVNCPVDVNVYDSNNNLVGSIVGDEPSENEQGIVTYVDFNGQKVIALPNNEEYTIRVTAVDSGTMTYTATEYNMDTGKTEKIVSYFEVPIVEGDALTGIAENIELTGSADYPLYMNDDSAQLDPSLVQSGNSVAEYQVTVSTKGDGRAIGGGRFVATEYAQVEAICSSNNTFIGWYQNDQLVSMEAIYRFAVMEDVEMVAHFVEETSIVVPPQVYYTLQVNSTEGGTVSEYPTMLPAYAMVSLSAKANEGYEFVGWEATAGSFSDPTTTDTIFTMPTTSAVVTAVFQPIPEVKYTLRVTSTEGGSASPSVYTATAQTEIPLYAYANEGYEFVGWEATAGAFSDPQSKQTVFSMPASDVTVIAVFQLKTDITPPQTGDATPLEFYWLLMCASVCAAIIYLKKSNRRAKKLL